MTVGTSDSRHPPPKPPLRVLLFSDVLLDRPHEWAPPAVADARRDAAREALVETLGVARSQQVDLIACAGDLFDRRTVRPTTMQWLIAALRSAAVPVLVAPGNRDFVGPLGGYSNHEWPDNVTVFDTDRFTPANTVDGVTIWGAAHTEAHHVRSFFDHFEVDRDTINLALFHGADRAGAGREPDLDLSAPFDEDDLRAAGLDHALVGHYQTAHFGAMHTYPGAPIAHDFGSGHKGGAVIVTVTDDGTVDREFIEVASPGLYQVEADVSGATSIRDVVERVQSSLGDHSGTTRLRLTGKLPPEIVVRRDDLVAAGLDVDDLVDWAVHVDIDLEELAAEQTVRGQFVRDVLANGMLDEERRERVLLIGLRALSGSPVLEGRPR